MSEATFIALGAAAIGLVTFGLCLFVAISAKKKAARQPAQKSAPEA